MDKNRTVTAGATMNDTQRHCPVCKALVENDEVRCPVCTSVLPPPDSIRFHKKEPKQRQIAPSAELEPRYVGFGPRCIAAIVDTACILLLILPCAMIGYGREYFTLNPLVKGPLDVLITWLLPAVAVILFWICCGATPGKMLIGARIVDAVTGKKAKPLQYIARYYAYFVSAFPLCAGFCTVMSDPKRQGWHDKLAGTIVVQTPHTARGLRQHG